MLEGIVLFVVILIIAGIVWLSNEPKASDQNRGKSLKQLAEFLDGNLSPIEGMENSYKIDFVFDLKTFSFEYIEDVGISTKQYKGFLKSQTNSNIFLNFTEREGKTIRTKISTEAEMAVPWALDDAKIKLPKELQYFKIHTNEPQKVARLLASEKVLDIFCSFADLGSRGYPVEALEIIDGLIRLKFHPGSNTRPNLMNVWDNPSRIEEYLDKMIVVINRVNAVESKLA